MSAVLNAVVCSWRGSQSDECRPCEKMQRSRDALPDSYFTMLRHPVRVDEVKADSALAVKGILNAS